MNGNGGTAVRCDCHGRAKMCEVEGTTVEVVRDGHVVVIPAADLLAMMAGTVGKGAIMRFVGSLL